MVEHGTGVPPLGNTPEGPDDRPEHTGPDPMVLAGQRALREALRLAAAGYVLVPVTIWREPDGKKRAEFHIGWSRGGTVRPDVLRAWSIDHVGCSFAILCGASGIEVVDLDAAEGGPGWWTAQGLPTSAFVVDTPGGGQHLYFRRRPGGELADRLVNNAGQVAPGVDARTVGGLVFAPGAYVVGQEDRPYIARATLPEPDRLELTPRAVLGLWSRVRDERTERMPATGAVAQDRRFTQDEAGAYVATEARDPLMAATYGVDVNDTLNRAALVVGHFVPEFWSVEQARAALGEWLLAGPGARQGWTALDREDEGSITSGLRRGMAEPYARRVAPSSNHLADGVPLPVSTETAGPGTTSTNAVNPVDGYGMGLPPAMLAPTPLDVAVERGRVQRAARRILDAEERPPAQPPSSTGLAALLAEPPSATRYRVANLWPSGGKVLLNAPAKAGKTTMINNLVRCLADATPFLAAGQVAPGDWIVQASGFAVEPLGGRRVMLLDLEMTRDMLREWLRDQRIANLDGVQVELMRGRAWDPRDEVQRAAWAAHLKALDVAVLIVDPIGPVLAALGLDESSTQDVGSLLWSLDALCADAGITELFVVHHAGHEGERARGASAFEGWPDAMWTLVRDKSVEGAGRRALRAAGRDVHLSETVLDLDQATRRLSLGEGSRASARGAEHAEIIRDIVVQEHQDRAAGAPRPTTNELKRAARETVIGNKVQDAQDAIAAARRLGMVHTHDGPNRSLWHYPGSSCDGCPDAILNPSDRIAGGPSGGSRSAVDPCGP